jgi:hypothetical protein
MDIMPEIMDGKNVADFVDPDIAEKLEALEREEERLQGEGFYDNEEDIVSSPFSKISRPSCYPVLTSQFISVLSLILTTNEKRRQHKSRSHTKCDRRV